MPNWKRLSLSQYRYSGPRWGAFHLRRGYMLIEVCTAAAILALLLPIVAQLAYSSMIQRVRAQSERTALELAQNVVESARARSIEDLTSEWASAQKIPEQMASLLPDGKLTVKIEPEKYEVRRVTVVITWQNDSAGPHRELQLVTLLGPRVSKRP